MTVPYVIEGENSKEKVYDLYSRMLRDRVVFIWDVFTPELAKSIVGQLLFLEADDKDTDIVMYINSPGGNVTDALAIYDTMSYIKPDIVTVCIGQACSAAAFILAAGTKGKRKSLSHSRIMLHQVSAGADGHIEDMRTQYEEALRSNNIILKELSILTGKKESTLRKDVDRDKWLSAEEALRYGIIDEILTSRS